MKLGSWLVCGLMLVASQANAWFSPPVVPMQTMGCSSMTLTVPVPPNGQLTESRSAWYCPPQIPPTGTAPPPVVLAFPGHGGVADAFAQATYINAAWPEALVIYMQPVVGWGLPQSAYYDDVVDQPLLTSAGTGASGDTYGTGTGWQWILNSTNAQQVTKLANQRYYYANPVGLNKDLYEINWIIGYISATYYGGQALPLYGIGFSNGAAFLGVVMNQSGGQTYPNFQWFKGFAFNAVLPDSGYDGFIDAWNCQPPYNNYWPYPANARPKYLSASPLIPMPAVTSSATCASWQKAEQSSMGLVSFANGGADTAHYNTTTGVTSGVYPTELLSGSPKKPMAMAVGCYDSVIPYQFDYPSIQRAEDLLGIPAANRKTPDFTALCQPTSSNGQGMGTNGPVTEYDAQGKAQLLYYVHTQRGCSDPSTYTDPVSGVTVNLFQGHLWPTEIPTRNSWTKPSDLYPGSCSSTSNSNFYDIEGADTTVTPEFNPAYTGSYKYGSTTVSYSGVTSVFVQFLKSVQSRQ
jgi:hypothetical protein